MERKLATIVKVESVENHPNADLLDICQVRGWNVITKRDKFEVGDYGVYFEIDSFIPVRPEFEFLRASSYKNHPDLGEGFRLRTIKLRQMVSQGLLLPLSILDSFQVTGSNPPRYGHPRSSSDDLIMVNFEEDADVTELLGVRKWESPVSASMQVNQNGNFPSWMHKSEQNRIQNSWKDNNMLPKETLWEVSEKMDGSSITIYLHHDFGFGICSRNFDLKLDDGNCFVSTALTKGYKEALEALGISVAIQGELCGPGIQGNKYKLQDYEIFVYDVFLIACGRYATHDERQQILANLRRLGAKVIQVPMIDIRTLPKTIKEVLEMAEGRSAIYDTEREGLVFKSMELQYNQTRVESFKAISNKFLLKNKE